MQTWSLSSRLWKLYKLFEIKKIMFLQYYRFIDIIKFVSLKTDINKKIKQLNLTGKPVIFIVTGNNSAGKTTICRKLIQDFDFYQSINLGVVSKMIRYFRPDINSSSLENFDGNEATSIFKNLVRVIIGAYSGTGVNLIIDGVQIDTKEMLKENRVIGVVVLKISPTLSVYRGNKPDTHFKRQLSRLDLKHIKYWANSKFKIVNNEGRLDNTYHEVIIHLNGLLDDNIN